MKILYPLIMRLGGKAGRRKGAEENTENKTPPVSFYSLEAVLNNGETLDFGTLRGKKVLLANTASDCGYTPQYGELEALYEQCRESLVILAFPANDFKEQEQRNDGEIAAFCKLNYGVSFPLMRKTVVVKGAAQHPVFQWLTDASKNGWNSQAPVWNFCKYLVDEQGVLTNYFAMTVSPKSPEILQAVRRGGSDR